MERPFRSEQVRFLFLPDGDESSSSQLTPNALAERFLELSKEAAAGKGALASHKGTQLLDPSYEPRLKSFHTARGGGGGGGGVSMAVSIAVPATLLVLLGVGAAVVYKKRKGVTEWLLWKLGGMRFSECGGY